MTQKVEEAPVATPLRELNRSLGVFDSTMIVAGSMIGSGIFIVAGEMAREVGSAGWLLLAWVIAGVLTLAAALSYGELAAMMPRAGGQYVYLREAYSPLWGFLYGWTLFLVIQTGTIAASSVGFSRYLGVLWPQISETNYIIPPIHILPTYALSLSTAQLVALSIITFLTWTNMKGLKYGKGVQNVFTTDENRVAARGDRDWRIDWLEGFRGQGQLRARVDAARIHSGWTWALPCRRRSECWWRYAARKLERCTRPTPGTTSRSPRAKSGTRPVTYRCLSPLEPSSSSVCTCFANFAYVVVLPFSEIQHAPSDRVAATMLQAIFPSVGPTLIAVAIMIAAFGCMNALILVGGSRLLRDVTGWSVLQTRIAPEPRECSERGAWSCKDCGRRCC